MEWMQVVHDGIQHQILTAACVTLTTPDAASVPDPFAAAAALLAYLLAASV